MKHNTNRTIRRALTFGAGVALGLSFLTGTASATTASGRGNQGQTSATKDCDGTHHSNTGHGANTSGAYDNTCDGSPSRNGSDKDGTRGSRPCAGCVGNADDKNPPGQYPDGPTDHNNGYECDQKGRSANEGNNGVGFGNPAHTGCAPSTTPDDGGEEPTGPTCPAGDAAMTQHDLTVDGGHGTAVFTIAAGCADVQLSLASYDANGTLVDSDTGIFGAGDHELTVDVPACGHEVDFVRGTIANGSLIETDKAMAKDCTQHTPETPGTPGTPGTTETPCTGGNMANGNTSCTPGTPGTPGASVVAASTEQPVVAAAVLAADVTSVTPAAPVDVLGVDLPAVVPGHPTEVLGVQLERAPEAVAAAGLARTGSTLLPLSGLGVALCLLGVVLTGGKRRQQPVISITDRLAGF